MYIKKYSDGNIDSRQGNDFLVAKVLRSTIASGVVTSINASDAEAMPGVIKVFTCLDTPENRYHTTDVSTNCNVPADRVLLARNVKYYGEPIAVVVAKDERTACLALSLIKVEYTAQVAVTEMGATSERNIQEHVAGNRLSHIDFAIGETSEEGTAYSSQYTINSTRIRKSGGCFSYMKNDRLYIVTGADAFSVRNAVGAVIDLPISALSVERRLTDSEMLFEPLCAYVCTKLDGRGVSFLSESETLLRAPMKFKLQSTVSDGGNFIKRDMTAKATCGAYRVDAEIALLNSSALFRNLYSANGTAGANADSYLTNTRPRSVGEGVGLCGALFAIESHIDDIAFDSGVDPMLFRIKNCIRADYNDPLENLATTSYGLDKCIIRGRELTNWDAKRKEYSDQNGDIRKGLGMSIFCYNETQKQTAIAVAKLIIEADGSVLIDVGHTVNDDFDRALYTKFVSDTLGISSEHIGFCESSELYPNAGRYATSFAIKEAATNLKTRLVDHANLIMGCEVSSPDINNGFLSDSTSSRAVISVADIAKNARENGIVLLGEGFSNRLNSSLAFGACFAEVTVNLPLCSIEVTRLVNVTDGGVIHLPDDAKEQALHDMADAIETVLGEEFLIDPNGSLHDPIGCGYNLGACEMEVEFVNTIEPVTAFGDKPLGKSAFISVAPAVRNAVLNATGIKFNSLPITSKQLFTEFKTAGML